MIVFDVEADNLLDDATMIHCLSYTSDGMNYKTLFDYQDMRDLILSQRGLIGHNIIRYDAPLLEKILGIKIQARYSIPYLCHGFLIQSTKHGLESFGEDFGIPNQSLTIGKTLPKRSMHTVVQRM